MSNRKKQFDAKAELLKAIDHFAHILPAQATIRDFVHHNTLHGFEHLKFEDALKSARELTGAYGFWPQQKFRQSYIKGRITDFDIEHALYKDDSLNSTEKILDTSIGNVITRSDVYRVASLFPLKKISNSQLRWQIDENNALDAFQLDVPEHPKESIRKANTHATEAGVINSLWKSCKETVTTNTPSISIENNNTKNGYRQQSQQNVDDLLSKLGDELTLRSILKQMTGVDVQSQITPYLLPYLANWLDEGFAAWHANDKKDDGFYQSWKTSALKDKGSIFKDISDWSEHIESLPDSATETVIAELTRMDIPQDKWDAYVTRLALDIPGWSGMFYWRHSNPDYQTPFDKTNKAAEDSTQMNSNEMMDYLAVRLVLEHLHIKKLCREIWLIEANVTSIRGYFRMQTAESYVRYALYNQELTEPLINASQQLVENESFETHKDSDWADLANKIWESKLSSSSGVDKPQEYDAWILFRLAQHLGLTSLDIQDLSADQLDVFFDCIAMMTEETAGFVLLQAYEYHYREEMFNAVMQNQGRGTWEKRDAKRPEAQLFFCMDDREEGFRRHLEHLNPSIETFGAAAFFGVVMNWKDVDEDDSVVLCPVVVTPVHEVQEIACSVDSEDLEKHQKRFAIRSKARDFIHQDSHQSLIQTSLLSALYAPAALITLLGKVIAPLAWNQTLSRYKANFDTPKQTRIKFSAEPEEAEKEATPEHRQLGFTTLEQVNIVEGFLQNNGLQTGFSPLVVLLGHYSNNQNNSHAAAYGCGACGGKFSGPNGRVYAAMANNPLVRTELAIRNIHIPDDTWFLGAEHDTCNEHIQWADEDLIPHDLQKNFIKLKADLAIASQHSAHERCRKLASAPKKPNLVSALKHIAGRGVDFSQARPELGHATIAAGFVGRRYLSQGLFMDRRCFLISYDASTDSEGAFLERILLSAGPVGAGINLEYYFSSVNNERYGCGSKIVHNLSGLFGVMEGSSGDLRTGLPMQMIEIHEPMRLQLMVEASIDTLTEIYKRQPSIQQLVGNGWILLSAKDPESATIHTFNPTKGWELWQPPDDSKLVTVKESKDWYSGHYDHLGPALIEIQSTTKGTDHA